MFEYASVYIKSEISSKNLIRYIKKKQLKKNIKYYIKKFIRHKSFLSKVSGIQSATLPTKDPLGIFSEEFSKTLKFDHVCSAQIHSLPLPLPYSFTY